MARILICSNFSGRYNDYYLGHDFINLFPSDSGEWNFYVPSSGCVRADFGKGKEPDYLVMVDYVNGKYRLLGIATGLEYASNCHSASDVKEIESENKANGSIAYFGRSLKNWFALQPNILYVSYKLKENGYVYMPLGSVLAEDWDLLADHAGGNDIFVELGKSAGSDGAIEIDCSWSISGHAKKLIGQGQRSYYEDSSKEQRFKAKIDDLISKGLLRDVTRLPPMLAVAVKAKFGSCSILDEIGKENDENVISRWFAEYLADADFYDYFAGKLGLSKSSVAIDVATELADSGHKRVDITIDNGAELILIENKVHSPVHTTVVGGKAISQLDAYIYNVNKDLTSKEKARTVKTFLLCPDYYEAYGYAGDPNLWDKSVWEPLYYSKLKEIVDGFMAIKGILTSKSSEYPYMGEFSKAISIHAKGRPESLRESILRKIAKKI